MSRINDCVPLGKTGYPFALAMNVDAGTHRYLTGSANHWFRTVEDSGNGGVRSRAVAVVSAHSIHDA